MQLGCKPTAEVLVHSGCVGVLYVTCYRPSDEAYAAIRADFARGIFGMCTRAALCVAGLQRWHGCYRRYMSLTVCFLLLLQATFPREAINVRILGGEKARLWDISVVKTACLGMRRERGCCEDLG